MIDLVKFNVTADCEYVQLTEVGHSFSRTPSFVNYLYIHKAVEGSTERKLSITLNPSRFFSRYNLRNITADDLLLVIAELEAFLLDNGFIVEELMLAEITMLELRVDISLDDPYPYYLPLLEVLKPLGTLNSTRHGNSYTWGTRKTKQFKVYNKELEMSCKRSQPEETMMRNHTRLELRVCDTHRLIQILAPEHPATDFTIADLFKAWDIVRLNFCKTLLDSLLHHDFENRSIPTQEKLSSLMTILSVNSRPLNPLKALSVYKLAESLGTVALLEAFKTHYDRSVYPLKDLIATGKVLHTELDTLAGSTTLYDQLDEIRTKIKSKLLDKIA